MSLTRFRRTSATAAVLALALTTLGACGGDDEPESAADSAASSSPSSTDGATDDTTDDSSDDVSEEPADTEDAAPVSGDEVDPSEFAGMFQAAFDKATTTQITMSSEGAMALQATGEADFTNTPFTMHVAMSVPQATEPLDMILVDGVMYIKVPGAGGKYLANDLDDPTNPYGGVIGDQLDPRQMFDSLEAGIVSATYVGDEGDLRHYSMVADPSALLGEEGLPSGAPSDMMPKEVAYDMWFDDEGLFRKMVVDLGEVGGKLTVTYDNWGEPVDIQAPAANQIMKQPGI